MLMAIATSASAFLGTRLSLAAAMPMGAGAHGGGVRLWY
jgi:hypothetical protein